MPRLAAPLIVTALLLIVPLAAAGADGWTDQDFEAGVGAAGPDGSTCDPSQDPAAAGVEARVGGACWNVPANATLVDLHLKGRVDTGGLHGAFGLYDASGKSLKAGEFCDYAGNITVPAGAKVIAIRVGGAPSADCAPGSTPAGKVYLRFRALNDTANATAPANASAPMPPAPASPTPTSPTPASPTPDVTGAPERIDPAQAPGAKVTPGPGAALFLAAIAMGLVLARRR